MVSSVVLTRINMKASIAKGNFETSENKHRFIRTIKLAG